MSVPSLFGAQQGAGFGPTVQANLQRATVMF
jgi:hypothetical protein